MGSWKGCSEKLRSRRGCRGSWGAGRGAEEIGKQDRVQWEVEGQKGVQRKLGSRTVQWEVEGQKGVQWEAGEQEEVQRKLGSRRGFRRNWGAGGRAEEVGKQDGVVKSSVRLCKEPHLAEEH